MDNINDQLRQEQMEYEKKYEKDEKNNNFLLVYKTGSKMSEYFSFVVKKTNINQQIVNREVLLDTLGNYNIVFSNTIDLETITDLIVQQCLGYSLDELKQLKQGLENQKMTIN